MKKRTYLSLALALCMGGNTPLLAQENTLSPTASKVIYDFAGFTDSGLLELFYQALKKGQNYPTPSEFEAAGIQASDIAFVRSHVRKQALLDNADRVVPGTYAQRKLWLNIPMGSGKGGDAGYPTANFASDVFSMWNYCNLFGSWNHSIFTAPGCWVDAAHKNGADIMSGIKFFDTTGGRTGGAEGYVGMITQKETDGSFKYVKPLINCLMFFGSDGINYNFEAAGYDNADVIKFHKELYKEAKAQGFDNFHIGMYTAHSALTDSSVDALFGTSETGKTADLMLNYSGGDFAAGTNPASVRKAEEKMGTTDGLYTGVWIVTMNRDWKSLDNARTLNDNWEYEYTPDPDVHKIGVCLWGEHDNSRFWSYNSGSDAYDAQHNYQRLLERGFSGGNRNPVNRPTVTNTGIDWEGSNALTTFSGLAEWIPERSTIQGNLPFAIHFNLGNGDRYFYKGKRTTGSWYNMAAQDRVPTYRWLVYNKGTENVSTAIQPSFTHMDAYLGGSSLLLTGMEGATGTDIILYKTDLKVSAANSIAKIALKKGATGNTTGTLCLLLRVDGTWKEFPLGENTSAAWEEQTLPLGLSIGAKIDRIGLRLKDTQAGYSMMVGKLELNDDIKTTPANVKDVVVEVKEETKGSLSAKIFWDVDMAANARAAWGLLFNDEANIDHFQVLYKNGKDGHVTEVSRTTQWADFVSNIYFTSEADKPFIGVRSVSTDLKTYSPVVWVEVERANQDLLPDLVVEDSYGISRIDPNSAGIQNAYDLRWVTSVTSTGALENLNYSATGSPADKSQYADARNQVLKVRQGQTVNMHIQPYNTTGGPSQDGIRYCFGGGWIDWNGSGNFDHPDPVERTEAEIAAGQTSTDPLGERIFFCGQIRKGTPEMETQGIDVTFKVPEDAHVGPSRLRIVFSDAWFAGSFLPTGLTNKGFTLDFGVEIEGDPTNQRTSGDTRDQGQADQPDGLSDYNSISTTKGGVSHLVLRDGVISFQHVDKAWIYTADGKLVNFLHQPSTISTAGMRPGIYLVKMQSGQVIRSTKVALK